MSTFNITTFGSYSYPKAVARNLPNVAPITREGVKAPPDMPAPYVQQVRENRARKKIHRVDREKAPTCKSKGLNACDAP